MTIHENRSFSRLSWKFARLSGFHEMPDFVPVALTEHVVSGTGALVKIADTAVALFNVDRKIFAIHDVCIRCGSSLAAGELQAMLVRCSHCGWKYDVATGGVMGVPALRTQTFETKVVNTAVLVATTARPTF